MRIRLVAPASVAVLVAALTACAPVAPEARTPTTVSTSPPAASMPSSSPTETATPLMVIGVEGVSLGERSASYTDAAAVIALVKTATGTEPTESVIEDPWGNGTEMGRKYDFGAISVNDWGGRASVSAAASTADVRVETRAGLSVGDSRAAAEDAGAWEEYAGGDGIPAALGIDPREVPGTTSLSRTGETGREYVLLILDGDAISQIQAPGNDYADL